MERLGNVIGGKLRIRCSPCHREGRYLVSRLVEVHGPDMSLETLRERLAVGCRWRRPAGMREPGKYEPRCQARLVVPTIKTATSGDGFTFATPVFRIDIWHDDDSGIEREILLATDLALARKWFEDVVARYPGKIITLRQRAHVLQSTERKLSHGTGGW